MLKQRETIREKKWLPLPQPPFLKSYVSPLLPSLVISDLKMEISCFSETLWSTYEIARPENQRQHQHLPPWETKISFNNIPVFGPFQRHSLTPSSWKTQRQQYHKSWHGLHHTYSTIRHADIRVKHRSIWAFTPTAVTLYKIFAFREWGVIVKPYFVRKQFKKFLVYY
jgi:hypothetical protein